MLTPECPSDMGRLFDIQPFTLLDFPGEIACIAWFAGCNLRCVYCHNPAIVLSKGEKDESELISFLQSRKGKLTGVVFSGGEPTFAPTLADTMRQVRALGYKIKLDTNGSNPQVVAALLDEGLLDYVALDDKCPPGKAKALIGTDRFMPAFHETLVLLIAAAEKGLGFEIRTTFHSDYMDEADLAQIIDDLDALGYRGTYYIQNIGSTGDKTLGHIEKPTRALDRARLPQPRRFTLSFRNFPDEKKNSDTSDQ
jgi:pyruvate formate lyase activating enzyme